MGCIHSTYIFKKRSRKNDELDESKYDGVLRGVENRDINIEWKDTKPFVVPLNGGHVIKVYDGDTITIANKLPIYHCNDMFRFSVRLNGIDTPEIKQTCLFFLFIKKIIYCYKYKAVSYTHLTLPTKA